MGGIGVGFLFVSMLGLFVSNAVAATFDFRQWCGRTTHKDVCISAIISDPRTNLRNSPSGLCTILNDKSKRVADATFNKIGDLLNNATNPDLLQDLQLCYDDYDEVISRLKGLNFSILNNQTFTELNIALVLVLDKPGDCEEAFKLNQPTPIPSPLTVDNKNLENIVVITWNILNLSECDKISC